jgi:hypothetical protein
MFACDLLQSSKAAAHAKVVSGQKVLHLYLPVSVGIGRR